MGLRRWQKVTIGIIAIAIALIMVAGQLITVGVAEYYSPDWHSASVEEARLSGVLVSLPSVIPRTVTWGGVPLTVREAWVEQRSHLVYRLYLFRRRVKEDRYRLIVRMEPVPSSSVPTVTALGGAERLAFNDSLDFSTWMNFEYWSRTVQPPFPDTLRLSVRHR
jgi:hypothetical protein